MDSDSYFVIDPTTRAIKNTTGRPITLIEGDHNSEIFTFELPRYIEGHDMKLCTAVKVHYNNIGESVDEETGETIVKENSGVADLTDLRVNPEKTDTVICSWTIKRKATRLDGMMDFLIQYLCAEPDGTVTYEWHTDFFTDVTVKPGRNNGDSEIEEYTDLLEQWRARIFGAGDSIKNEIVEVADNQLARVQEETDRQIAAVVDKGVEVLDSIPEDYTTTSNTAEYAARQKANTIALEVYGDNEFTVDNASDSYLLGLNLYGKTEQVTTTGKNLLPNTAITETRSGITFTVNNDGSITANGTATDHIYFAISEYSLEPGDYIISGCDGGDTNTYLMYTQKEDSSGYVHCTDGEKTITISDTDQRKMLIAIYKDVTVNNLTFYPMISVGGGAYEPYSGGKSSPSPDYPQELESVNSPEITIRGCQLFDASVISTTSNGDVTLTNNNDGSFTISGVTTTESFSKSKSYTHDETINLLKAGTITLVADMITKPYFYLSIHNSTGRVLELNTADRSIVTSEIKEEWLSDPTTYMITGFFIAANSTIVPGTTKFMLYQDGDGSWEPYTKQTLTTPYTLPGIPVSSGGNYTDSNDQQWIADEIVYDYSNHTYKYVQNCFGTTITDFSLAKVTAPVNGFTEGYLTCGVVTKPKSFALCDGFIYAGSGDKVRFAMANASIYFTLEGELTAEEWRTKMTELSPTILVPRLKPIVHELTAEEAQAFKALHTNYSYTTFLNDSNAHMKVKYAADTKTYTDNLMILTDETTGTKYRLVVNNGTLSIVPLS